jgi:hypothetical protein
MYADRDTIHLASIRPYLNPVSYVIIDPTLLTFILNIQTIKQAIYVPLLSGNIIKHFSYAIAYIYSYFFRAAGSKIFYLTSDACYVKCWFCFVIYLNTTYRLQLCTE